MSDLSSGTLLGPYTVVAPLGAGGMGQVYRATDPRLKRQVGIKVLPSMLALDPERLGRFQREAEVLASLNHPHIAAIYGLEETDGVKALVMELVEGATLADRIGQGPIPIDEALSIASQIAEALEAAHERGIVHRDPALPGQGSGRTHQRHRGRAVPPVRERVTERHLWRHRCVGWPDGVEHGHAVVDLRRPPAGR